MRAVTFHQVLSVWLLFLQKGQFFVEASEHGDKNEPDQTALLQTTVQVLPVDESKTRASADLLEPLQNLDTWAAGLADESSKQTMLREPQISANLHDSPSLSDASAFSVPDAILSWPDEASKETIPREPRVSAGLRESPELGVASTRSVNDRQASWTVDQDSKQTMLRERRVSEDLRALPGLKDASKPSITDPQPADEVSDLLKSLSSLQDGLGSLDKHVTEPLEKHQSTMAFSPEDAKQSQSMSSMFGGLMRGPAVADKRAAELLPNHRSTQALPAEDAEQSPAKFEKKLEDRPSSTNSSPLPVSLEGQRSTNHVPAVQAPSDTKGQSSLHRSQSLSYEDASSRPRSVLNVPPQAFASSSPRGAMSQGQLTSQSLMTSDSNYTRTGVKLAFELEKQNLFSQQSDFSNALTRVANQFRVVQADEVKRLHDDELLEQSLKQGLQGVITSEKAVGIQAEYGKHISKFLADAVNQAEDTELIQQNLATKEDQASMYLETSLKELQATHASGYDSGVQAMAMEKALKNAIRAQAEVVAGASQQKQAAHTLTAALHAAADAATARQALNEKEILRSLSDLEDKINNLQSVVQTHERADTKVTSDMKDAVQEMDRASVASQNVHHSFADVEAAQRQQELALDAAQHDLAQKENKVMATVMEVSHKARKLSQEANEAQQALDEEKRKVQKQLAQDQRESQGKVDQILQQASEEKRQADIALRQAEEERKRAIMQADEEKARAVDNFQHEAYKIAEERREADADLRHAADEKRKADQLIQAAKQKQMQVEMEIRKSVTGLTHASRQVAESLPYTSGLRHRSRRMAESPDPPPYADYDRWEGRVDEYSP